MTKVNDLSPGFVARWSWAARARRVEAHRRYVAALGKAHCEAFHPPRNGKPCRCEGRWQ